MCNLCNRIDKLSSIISQQAEEIYDLKSDLSYIMHETGFEFGDFNIKDSPKGNSHLSIVKDDITHNIPKGAVKFKDLDCPPEMKESIKRKLVKMLKDKGLDPNDIEDTYVVGPGEL